MRLLREGKDYPHACRRDRHRPPSVGVPSGFRDVPLRQQCPCGQQQAVEPPVCRRCGQVIQRDRHARFCGGSLSVLCAAPGGRGAFGCDGQPRQGCRFRIHDLHPSAVPGRCRDGHGCGEGSRLSGQACPCACGVTCVSVRFRAYETAPDVRRERRFRIGQTCAAACHSARDRLCGASCQEDCRQQHDCCRQRFFCFAPMVHGGSSFRSVAGGLPCLSPANPAFSLLSCPHPPTPPSPPGTGEPKVISCKGLRPLHPRGWTGRGTG